MSRSKRHVPISGNAIANSDKKDKQAGNRRLRLINKKILKKCNSEEIIFIPKNADVYNEWNMSKDGKQFYKPPHENDEFNLDITKNGRCNKKEFNKILRK